MITSEKFEFFPAQRRKVELLDWRPLRNAQSEKRVRLDFLMYLTGQATLGMPNFVTPAYESMELEGSATTETDLGVELEGVTVEAFSTDGAQFPIEISTYGMEETTTRKVLLTSSTMRAFKLVRETRDKVEYVCLQFSVTTKRDLALLAFADRYEGGTFWCLFTETQPTIPTKTEENPDQMKLGEKPADAKPSNEIEKQEVCGASDGHGGTCVLAPFHDGEEHTYSNQPPVDLKAQSNGKGKGKRVN